MEEKVNVPEQILSVLSASPANETPLTEIQSATNLPKKSLNAELQKLKRQGLVFKIKDTPPVWSLKDSTKITAKPGRELRQTRSRTQAEQEANCEKQNSTKSVTDKIVKSKGTSLTMNKDISKRILSFLQGRGKAVKTSDIAKGVGCRTPKEINPTLYAMKRKNLVVKVTESPPSWKLSDDIPHDMLQQAEQHYQPRSFDQKPLGAAYASPLQYSAGSDGTIPAFQETSLFSSDVSFETDYSDLVAAGDPFNTNESLFDEDPQDQDSAYSRGLGDKDEASDKMSVGEGSQASSFRSFFKLDDSMSDDSQGEDISDVEDNSVKDNDYELGNSDDRLYCELSESNDKLNNFRSTEISTGNEVDVEQLTGDVSTLIEDTYKQELNPPVLENQELQMDDRSFVNVNASIQMYEDNNFDEESAERNNITNEISNEMVLPNSLPEQLPIDECSDDDIDKVDLADDNSSDVRHVVVKNAKSQENEIDNDLQSENNANNNLKEDLTCMAEMPNFNGQQNSVSSDLSENNSGMQSGGNINDFSITNTISLSSDCEKLLHVFSLDLPVAQFVLKSKSKMDEERLMECLQELQELDMAFKKGNAWQLTDNGKTEFQKLSGSNTCKITHSIESVEVPRKRQHTSGPPPPPMALLQEKGMSHQTNKEPPPAFQKGVLKPEPFKQPSNLGHSIVSAPSDTVSHSNVEKLNTDLFPSARTSTTSFKSSPALISSNSNIKSAQSTVTSTYPVRPAKAPVPLMSINMENRQSQTMAMSGLNPTGLHTISSSSAGNSLLGNRQIQQESRLFQTSNSNQRMAMSGLNATGQQTNSSSFAGNSLAGNRLIQQESSPFQTSNIAVRQPLNSLFKPTATSAYTVMPPASVSASKTQTSVTRSVFPPPSARTNSGQVAEKTSVSSFKPPLTPADILAKNLKKTEISPQSKAVGSSPVSLMSSSHNMQLNTAERSVAGNQSMFKPAAGPQSLVTGYQSGSQLSRGSSQSITSQSGIISSQQAGLSSSFSSQSGYKPPSPPLGSLGSHCGFKPLSALQSSRQTQGTFSSLKPQNTAIVRPPQQQSQPLSLDTESFAALNKNPVSALMEYAQSRKMEARIELIGRRGSAHRPTFEMAAFVGRRQFPSVRCSNKKDGKMEACDLALRQLIAEGQFHQQANMAPKNVVPPGLMTHFDKMAALTHRGFTALVSQIRSESFAGRKVIAGLIMKRSETDTGILISLGTGNRCITGQQLSLEGNTINDSHAEIITRRGFLRFLYKQLLDYDPNKSSPLFEKSPRGRVQVKPNITFHLYISTAPCGDGALFSPRDAAANNAPVDNRIRPPHNPTFSNNVQGLLRTKVEGGEGTIPIEAGFKGLTFDGVQRGERLLTMSCTDKVCRWNVVGLQGALLSHFLEPIYLDSLTLGLLYDHGHLARAVCCRVGQGNTDIDSLLPQGYKLNHPWLGRVTVCDPPREVQKTKALSVNWCFGDTAPEVVDGTLGLNLTSIEKEMFSRCSKRHLYNSFKKVCEKFGRRDLLSAQTYREAKDMATDFKTAKEAMLKKFKENKYGKWVSKPVEEEMFS